MTWRIGTLRCGVWGEEKRLPVCPGPGAVPHGTQGTGKVSHGCEGSWTYLLGDKLPILVLHRAVLSKDIVKLLDDCGGRKQKRYK